MKLAVQLMGVVLAVALVYDGSGEWPGARGATGAALVLVAVAVSEIGRRSK